MNLEQEIKLLLTTQGKLNSAITRRESFKQSQTYSSIIEATKFLTEDACLSSRIFCIKNNIHNQPLCSITSLPLKWNKQLHKFASVVGKNNINKNLKGIKKQNNNHLKDAKQNIKQQFIRAYKQEDFTLQSRDACKQFIETRLHQTECGRKHNFVDTLTLKNYHSICCSILYYTRHPWLDDENINWSERFFLLHHDAAPKECCNNANVKAKYCNFLKGYNAASSQSEFLKSRLHEIHNAIELQNFTIINAIDKHSNQDYVLKCNACSNIIIRKLTNARWKDIFCARCNGVTPCKSKAEAELEQFVAGIVSDPIMRNNKDILSGKELDIFVPRKNFAIEFHGLLWHSYGINYPNNADAEKNQHQNHSKKRLLCAERQIHLMQIFENEWNKKQQIVKSIICSKLGCLQQRIYARSCKVIVATKQQKKDFLNNNHLQGNDNSQIALALTYNDEIVSMMTFGHRQITAKKTYELIRFCCRLNTSVAGGASKLFKYFCSNYNFNTITTYADLRYCYDGSFYKKLGFIHKKTTLPAYWYTDTKRVLHRSNFQKHKLVKLGHDIKLTEKQIMMNCGWRRIWDCGHMVFEYVRC